MINQKFLDPYTIILGSGSPRRVEILTQAEIPFVQKTIPIEETYPPNLEISKVPEYLARKKASAFEAHAKQHDIILTADSIVVLNDEIIGKPKNAVDAVNILHRLSGQQHTVITGVCLFHKNIVRTFSSRSEVFFSKLSKDEIDYYVSKHQPFDKAGAYGIQDWIGHNKVKSIKGSFLNVKGLPMEEVYHKLIEFVRVLNKNE